MSSGSIHSDNGPSSARIAGEHAALQASPSATLPSSHRSPAAELRTPSPHIVGVQSALHAADSPASSHVSPSSITPLPHASPAEVLDPPSCVASTSSPLADSDPSTFPVSEASASSAAA